MSLFLPLSHDIGDVAACQVVRLEGVSRRHSKEGEMEKAHWPSQSESCRFDSYGRSLDDARRKALAAAPLQSTVVPSTYDTRYAPEHPDADWMGLVPKNRLYQKRHVAPTTHLQTDPEAGITTAPDDTSWGHRFAVQRVYPEKHCNEETTQSLVGGIDEPQRWKTTYRLQLEGTPTSEDLLYERCRRTGGKRQIQPPFKAGLVGRRARDPENTTSEDVEVRTNNDGHDGELGLVGYRSHVGATSLLGDLGKSIAATVGTAPTRPSGPGRVGVYRR